MKCEQIAELLPDYLQEALRPEQNQIVEQHLAACPDCTEVVALWKKLATLPDEQPSPASRERFEAMLHAWQSGRAENLETKKRPSLWSIFQWLRSPVGAVAWSIALLVIGAYVGLQLGSTKANSQDLAALHSELAGMRQLVALSMLQVLSALKHTLRNDPSVDVRLAALDALIRHSAQPQVRSSVVDALQEQQSPLVQVALIDQLVEWRDPHAAQHLEKLRQSPNLNPTVRQRADWAISKLN